MVKNAKEPGRRMNTQPLADLAHCVRAGFCALSQISPNSFYRLAMGTQRRARPSRRARARQSLSLSIPIRSRHAS